MNIAPHPRTLRVVVEWWVIQDGSFPRSSVGDLSDVALERQSSTGTQPVCGDSRTATARPAYGRAPRSHRDGHPTFLHLLYGDGWSAQWWTGEPVHGSVTAAGTFFATLSDSGIDATPRVRGRIRRMHLVQTRVCTTENGWSVVAGTERLTDIETMPPKNSWWPTENARDGDFVDTGILVELDLDDIPFVTTPFVAGALTVSGDTVWVLHSSDPVLLRVDMGGGVPVITRYLLELPIEPSIDRWARRIHAVDDDLWITSKYDIHLCTLDPDGQMSIDRYARQGAWATAVHDGRLYLLGSTRSSMRTDRRHGVVRSHPDAHPVRMLDTATRTIVPVDGPAGVTATRADRETVSDGTQWCVDGTHELRRIDTDGTTSRIDLTHATSSGTVRSIMPDPFTDPANADVVAAITVDATSLRNMGKPPAVSP